MDLISIEELIYQLKEKNISFGKGDPYNRLRYYTKMKWIPHMERKKDKKGVVTGHLPSNILDKIIQIEDLKNEGKNNREISEILKNEKNTGTSEKNMFYEILLILKKIKISYVVISFLLIAVLFELFKEPIDVNYVNGKGTKTNNAENEPVINNKILDSGIGIFPSNKSEFFIPTKHINENSKIIITFEDNLEYGNNYYISRKEKDKGFYLNINIPKAQDLRFNWMVIN
jgi:hypothetical protein